MLLKIIVVKKLLSATICSLIIGSNFNNLDLVICFTRYDVEKSIRMLSLYYHKIMGKIEEYEEKNI